MFLFLQFIKKSSAGLCLIFVKNLNPRLSVLVLESFSGLGPDVGAWPWGPGGVTDVLTPSRSCRIWPARRPRGDLVFQVGDKMFAASHPSSDNTYLIFVFFSTHTFWGLKILHSKVRKFMTKKPSSCLPTSRPPTNMLLSLNSLTQVISFSRKEELLCKNVNLFQYC